MRSLIPVFIILMTVSCTRNKPQPDTDPSKHKLDSFTVTVLDRAPDSAQLQWNAALNTHNADTVKYKIAINGRVVDSNIVSLTRTIHNLSADTAYNGRVYAYTRSGDTISAPFFLEILDGSIYLTDGKVINCFDLYTKKKVWQTNEATYRDFTTSPTIANNILYTNNGQFGAMAFDAKTGRKIWQTQLGSSPDQSTLMPIYSNGKIYYSGPDGIYCLDASTGSQIWQSPSRPPFNMVSVMAGNLLISGERANESHMEARNASTGAIVWKDTIGTQICENPAVYKNLLIFSGLDSKIYAIDHSNGKLVWKRDFSVYYDNFGADEASPVLYKDIVVVGSGNSGYYGLNAATGETVWNLPTKVWVVSAGIGGDKVYLSMLDNQTAWCYCLDAKTGKEIWRQPYGDLDDLRPPMCVKHRVYVGHIYFAMGIHVLNAHTGAPIDFIANNLYQSSYPTILDHDSTYYQARSGMIQ